MTLQAPHIKSAAIKAGTCPHGLPPSACPVCSGAAGGNSTSKRDIPRNAGEMTYNQCLAIGAMLKAQKAMRQSAKAAQQSHEQALIEFSKNILNTRQRLMDFSNFLSVKFPKYIAVPTAFLLITPAAKFLKILINAPVVILNNIQNFTGKFIDISDKLAAIYGEAAAAAEEKFAKSVRILKKKFQLIFFVTGTSETENEEKKIEEEKRTFELKTFIHKLYRKMKHKDNNNDVY